MSFSRWVVERLRAVRRIEHGDGCRSARVFLDVGHGGMAAVALRQLRGADAEREVVDVAVAEQASGLARIDRVEPSAFIDANDARADVRADPQTGENLPAVVEDSDDVAI